MTYQLAVSSKIIDFFWIPGYVGITENKIADQLARGTAKVLRPSFLINPYCIPYIHKTIWIAWNSKWSDKNIYVSA